MHPGLAKERIEASRQDQFSAPGSLDHTGDYEPFGALPELIGQALFAMDEIDDKEVFGCEALQLLVADLFKETEEARIANLAG